MNKLTQKEFLDYALAAGATFELHPKDKYELSRKEIDDFYLLTCDYPKKIKDPTYKELFEEIIEKCPHSGIVFKEQWIIGGQTGGNCWSRGGHSPISAEPETPFNEFMDFLKEIYPELTLVDYREKVLPLIEKSETSVSEYYGNYTNFAVKSISVTKLFDVYCQDFNQQTINTHKGSSSKPKP